MAIIHSPDAIQFWVSWGVVALVWLLSWESSTAFPVFDSLLVTAIIAIRWLIFPPEPVFKDDKP
jgi:hypothetical protein